MNIYSFESSQILHRSKRLYASKEYNSRQMKQIKKGLLSGIDVNVYSNPVFSWNQMSAIRTGIFYDLDVSIYAKPNINSYLMNKKKKELKKEKQYIN